MELYIVRHGETLWNREKRLQGREDIELSENGRKVARLTGEALMDTRIDKIFSSPLKRAYETAGTDATLTLKRMTGCANYRSDILKVRIFRS